MRLRKLKVQKVHENAKIPKYETADASGMDLAVCESYTLKPKEIKALSTGLKFQLPENFELQIRPRSGVSLKTNIRITNSPGTIDSSYTGVLMIIVENTSNTETFEIPTGYRIAQAVLCPVFKAIIEEDIVTDNAIRGSRGFGSTGVN